MPPARPAPADQGAAPIASSLLDAPRLDSAFYANEVPDLITAVPRLPRPTDTDFLIKTADDRFAAGKRAYQEGRVEDARREFNRSVEVLLAAPENTLDRPRLEQKLEQLVQAIYRYDVDQATAAYADDQPSFDKSPLDEILGMTFPIDPSLRSKVIEQVMATASQLPLEESDAVISYINFFSSDKGKRVIVGGLRRAGRYKPMIERILAEEGVPAELIFVAQAESGFLPRAVSNKLCVGLWQFLKSRGNEYGLNQTPTTDDRMDPERATRAAARHLHDLFNHFGDWYLALAAYNCGPGCVDRAVARTGFADFWALRRLGVLPKETSNYVPLIVAMTIMSKNAKDYGIDNLDLDPALEYDTIELPTRTHLALIADAVDRPLSELRELNPSLLRPVTPAGYAVRVPRGTLEAAETALSVIPADQRASWRLHRLEDGETLADVAKRFGTAASLIRSSNVINWAGPDDALAAGAWVAIPVAYPGERIAAPAATSKRRAAGSIPARSGKARAQTAAPRESAPQKSSAKAGNRPKATARRSAISRTPAS